MEILNSTAGLLVLVLFAVIVSVLIVAIGWLVARKTFNFIGNATLKRLLIEVGVISFILATLASISSNLDILVDLNEITNLIFVGIAGFLLGLGFVIVPMWAAARLAVPPKISAHITYLKVTVGLALVIFLAYGLPLTLLSGIFDVISDSDVALARDRNFPLFAGFITISYLFLFLFLRSIIEIISYAMNREYRPQIRLERPYGIHRIYQVLFWCFITLLTVWAVAYVLYLNREIHPNWLYIPSIYVSSYFPPGINSPTDWPPLQKLLISIPPFFTLLIGFFVVLRRIPERTAVLFAVLCLLYSLWGLDIFPRIGGPVFWSIRSLAWLFTVPVQLHFVLLFPQESETREENTQSQKSRSLGLFGIRLLYHLFIVASPFWIIFNLVPVSSWSVIMQEYQVWTPLLAGYGTFSALALVTTWTVTALILIYTLIALGKKYQTIEPEPSSGCLWVDILEGRQRADPPWRFMQYRGQFLAAKQLAFYSSGAVMAGILYIVWILLLFPLLISTIDRTAILGEAAIRFVFGIIFVVTLIAMRQLRLWEVASVLVNAFGWSILIIVLATAFTWLESQLEDVLVPIIGFLALFIMSKLSIDAWVLPRVYRRLWLHHSKWQEKLKSIEESLRDPQNQPTRYAGLLDYFSNACPQKASAAWLLVPSDDQAKGDYSVQLVKHTHEESNEELCMGKFRKYFGSADNHTYVHPQSDLVDRLTHLVESKPDESKVILVDRLLGDWTVNFRQWSLTLSQMLSTNPPEMVPDVSDETIQRVCEAGIALIVPLGGNGFLTGIFMIATDGAGDYYDKRDLDALSQFANSMSIWLAARRYV